MLIKKNTVIQISIQILRKCYSGVIHPIPLENLWPKFHKTIELEPPNVKRRPGCRRHSKRKDLAEKALALERLMKPKWNCSICNGIGHNIRSCTSEPLPKKPKGKPGRPKKN